MKRLLILIFVFGYAQADDVAMIWKTDRDDIFVWEIYVDGEANQGIVGSSRSALIEVEPGFHCFSMRGHPFPDGLVEVSQRICQQTNSDDIIEIEIDFTANGLYL